MKKRRFLPIIVLIILSIGNKVDAQENAMESMTDTLESNQKFRKVFIYTSVGFLESFSIGAGYQLSSEYALAFEFSVASIAGGEFFPKAGTAFGTRFRYSLPTKLLNSVNIETSLFFDDDGAGGKNVFIKGYFIDLNVCKEIIDKGGLRVFWSIGIYRGKIFGLSDRTGPSFKVGLNYNIF